MHENATYPNRPTHPTNPIPIDEKVLWFGQFDSRDPFASPLADLFQDIVGMACWHIFACTQGQVRDLAATGNTLEILGHKNRDRETLLEFGWFGDEETATLS